MNPNVKKAVLRSFAKVNLALDILGKRPDGYHDIESVMQTISLHDTLTLAITNQPGIRLFCDKPDVPIGEENLAYKAAKLFYERLGESNGLNIEITKRIPIQAGLGGGSGNSGSVLLGLNELHGRPFSQADLCDIASYIGSDAPFFVVGGTAFVCGRGEKVEPLPDIPTAWMLIIKPRFGVSTAWAYQRLDELRLENKARNERDSLSRRMYKSIETGNFEFEKYMNNDLERPAFERHPEIGEIKGGMIELGAKSALMCGSGSGVFGIFADETSACEAAENFSEFDNFTAQAISRENALKVDLV